LAGGQATDGQYAGRSYAGPSGNVLLPTEKGLYWRDGEGEGKGDRAWRVIDHHSGLTGSAVASALEDLEGAFGLDYRHGLDYWPGRNNGRRGRTRRIADALILGVVRDHRGGCGRPPTRRLLLGCEDGALRSVTQGA